MDVFIVIAMILAFIFFIRAERKEKEKRKAAAQQPAPEAQSPAQLDLTNQEVMALVDEVVRVVNDFLETGRAMSIFCDHNVVDFSGAIFLHVPITRQSHSEIRYKANYQYGASIHYINTSDPNTLATSCPAVRRNPQNATIVQQMDSFLAKYRDCYAPEGQAYVYCTKNTLAYGAGVEQLLYEQVRARCPLAEGYGNIIYNKSVYH